MWFCGECIGLQNRSIDSPQQPKSPPRRGLGLLRSEPECRTVKRLRHSGTRRGASQARERSTPGLTRGAQHGLELTARPVSP